ASCHVGLTADALRATFDIMNETDRIIAEKDLTLLDYAQYGEKRSIETVVRELTTQVKAFKALIESKKSDIGKANAALNQHAEVPREVTEALKNAAYNENNLKRRIFLEMPLIMHLTCMLERRKAPNSDHHPCESFDLFPKRSGT